MKKPPKARGIFPWRLNYALKMKLSLLFFLTLSFLMQANFSYSQKTKISLDREHVTVREIIDEIETTTEFKFLFNTKAVNLDRKVSIKVRKVPIEKVLELLFKAVDTSYEVDNRKILLRRTRDITTQRAMMDSQTLNIKLPQFQISGNISDSKGQPLPGANILEKGTLNGTQTDFDGNFSIEVADENAILVISYIGFASKEVALNGQSTIEIILEESAAGLDEVVVIGYGTQTVKDLTGAVSTVSEETIENRQSLQLSDALQGTTAGVTVTRGGGGPGQSAQIRVRGITSLNVNDPLIVVDGVQGLSLDDINPNDVQSITVLKDAASQAIYGARAASGVILVTTKRAKEGKLSIDYGYELGLSSPTELPSFVGAQTYRTLANEYSTNDGGGETYDPEKTANYMQLNAENPDLFPNTDWQEAILSKGASTRQRHNLAFSIGSKSVSSRASMSYVTEDAIYPTKDFERYTFRINNNFKFSETIEMNFDISYRRTNRLDPSQNNSGDNNIVNLSRIYPSIYTAIRSDGEWGEGKDGENPLANLIDGGTIEQNFNQLNGRIGLTLKPMKNVVVQANFVPTFDFNEFDRFVTPPLIPRVGSTTEFWPSIVLSSLEKQSTDITNLSSQATVTYSNEWDNHNFSILGGYEEVSTKWERFGTTSRDLSIERRALGFGDPTLTQNFQDKSKNRIRSYFGRLTYDYKDRYLLQSNFRADGSSRFSSDNRWGYFPSLSLGWVVSNEEFSLPDFMSFLKLRASYGEVGNERIGTSRTGGDEFFNYYPYLSLFETVNSVIYDGNNFLSALGVTQNFLADEGIVWESTQTVDGGADINFFDNRLALTADYYRKRTDDIIITLDLPDYLGFPNNTKTNVGSIEVKGWDFGLGYRDNLGELGFAVNTNLSFVDSKILNVGGIETFLVEGDTKIHTQGASFGEWYGYETNGLFQNQQQIDDSYGEGSRFKPGDIWLVDQLTLDTNDDGIPDTSDNVLNGEDRVPLGPSLPKITYGGNISLDYKGIDFALAFNGVGKHTRRFENIQVRPLGAGFHNIPEYVAQGTWRPGNTPQQNLAAEFPRLSGASEDLNYAVSEFWLYNASYLRIQNLTLGYTFPSQIVERAKLQRLRLYLSLRNFFTFEKNFLDGWDPEVDFNGDPVLKSVLLGINVRI